MPHPVCIYIYTHIYIHIAVVSFSLLLAFVYSLIVIQKLSMANSALGHDDKVMTAVLIKLVNGFNYSLPIYQQKVTLR